MKVPKINQAVTSTAESALNNLAKTAGKAVEGATETVAKEALQLSKQSTSAGAKGVKTSIKLVSPNKEALAKAEAAILELRELHTPDYWVELENLEVRKIEAHKFEFTATERSGGFNTPGKEFNISGIYNSKTETLVVAERTPL